MGNGSHNSNLANTTMLLLLDSFKQHAVDSVFFLFFFFFFCFCLGGGGGGNCRLQMSRFSPKEVVHKIIRFDNCGIAQLVECPTEKPGAILTLVRVPCVARDFSSKANFSRYPVCKLHASTSVRMLKIPHSGSHTIVWIHENTAHIDMSG